jgi:secreted PhoX family phosphatase
MNCGGINSADGRIWTAEEWYQGNNYNLNTYYGTAPDFGVRDTADYTISTDVDGSFNGTTVPKWQNFNYMVEIDPREAVAIRKQYNWGKMGFEGGTVMPDNKTVYLGVDGTPAAWVKFVADNAGDFTSGELFVYKHDASANNRWIKVNNSSMTDALTIEDQAWAVGATMYNRAEWVARSINGKVYFTETGRDNPGSRWRGEHADGGVYAPHHIDRALQQGTHPDSSAYTDYYGRVMEFDPATDEMRVFMAGGPEYLGTDSVPMNLYPNIHLSNPDGLSFLRYQGREYMIIQEDLNGTSHGRTPGGISNRLCEVYLLDMGLENPNYGDLIRITAVPAGAEVTGARATPDGKTILLNSQHPSSNNPYPYNNSLTFAITGWDQAIVSGVLDRKELSTSGFGVYPNPATRMVNLNKVSDIAIYNMTGARIRVERNVKPIDVQDLPAGAYFILNEAGESVKLIIE